MKNLIVLSINSEFLALCHLFLKVIKKNYCNHPEILIWHSGLSQKELDSFKNYAKIKLEENPLELSFKASTMKSHFHDDASRTLYSRFELWSKRFDSYDGIIFMDVDMYVTDSLEEVFNKSEFFSVQDPFANSDRKVFSEKKEKEITERLKEDDIRIPKSAANGGFLYIPKKCRTEDNYQLLWSLQKKYHRDVLWADQSILALWMGENGLEASESEDYNLQVRRLIHKEHLKKLDSAKVIHFNGIPGEKWKLFLMKCFNLLEKLPLNLKKTLIRHILRLSCKIGRFPL